MYRFEQITLLKKKYQFKRYSHKFTAPFFCVFFFLFFNIAKLSLFLAELRSKIIRHAN